MDRQSASDKSVGEVTWCGLFLVCPTVDEVDVDGRFENSWIANLVSMRFTLLAPD